MATARKSTLNAEDVSLETTVPTDLSFSPDEVSELHTTDDDRRRDGRSTCRTLQSTTCIGRQQMATERRHLAHEIQELKVELAKKNLVLENMEMESRRKISEMEQKLGEAIHHRQILQARLDAQLAVDNEEVHRRQEAIAHELETIMRRQQQLEATNERLQEKAVDIRRSLKDLELTDAQYHELRLVHEDDLALKDFVAMKLFESQRPWKVENEGLKSRCKQLSDELIRFKSVLDKCQDELNAEKEARSQLEQKHNRLSLAYADVKSQVQHGDYKIENYDRVKNERDEFERQLGDLQKEHAYLDTTHQVIAKEREELSAELMSVKQSVSLLSKDKDFYAKQLCQLETKLRYADDRIVQLNEQLERTKQAREDLFNEYVTSRDKYRSDYEEKLRNELEQIRLRTDTEIDRLKSSTREMYERENRSLREARDHALSEKDRAVNAEKDTNTKYEQLLQDFRQQQMSHDCKMSELHNEVKLKAFEAERTQLVYEETCRTLKQVQLDSEKLHAKLEVLTKEYYTLQMSMEKRISELETVITEKTVKLESYEKLEHELDEVVMQAADVENEDDAERVLFSYGYGANVPTTAKRRLKQSVQLARRVLHLERLNGSLHKELEREQLKVKQLTDELKSANKLLDESHQPHQYLIESIRQRDLQIQKLRQVADSLETDLRHAELDRTELTKAKNQLALDLERLLSHKEEMAVMKQVVLNLGQPQYSAIEKLTQPGPRATVKKVSGIRNQPGPPRPSVTFEQAERDENVYKPLPTEFIQMAGGPADWYGRLKGQGSRPSGDHRHYPAPRHTPLT